MVEMPNTVHSQTPSLRTGLKLTGILGIIATITFFVGGGIWAATTEISGAVIATGSVEVVGRPKSVQHLDGGIIEDLNVGDGDFVERGEVILRLDDTTLLANLSIARVCRRHWRPVTG